MTDQLRSSRGVTPDTNLEELITSHPLTARVFMKHGMSCVGCDIARFESLEDACRIYHRPLEPLLEDLRRMLVACE